VASQAASIVRTVQDWIDAGRLMPGDEIDEAALIAEFGVSRTPLREALLTLEAQGLVRRLPRKGAVVFKPSLAEFLAILEVHAQLEGQAAGLAARRLSPAGAAALEAATAACEDHAARLGQAAPDAYYQLNLRFHACVAEAAGNPFLVELIKTNARKLMAYYRLGYRYAGTIAGSAAEHRAITAAILARDGDRAEGLMRRHCHYDQITAMDLLAALG